MMFEIKRYSPALESEWNAFVERSKNGTFLIDRRYMDYHAHRFVDHSLMFYRDGSLFALLPGNITTDEQGRQTLHSHQGLTYGGLILATDATATAVVTLFNELNAYLKIHDIAHVTYKAIPWIYHKLPAEEDLYALVCVCHASLATREISSAIALNDPLPWARDRRYGINKARNNGVEIYGEQAETTTEAQWRSDYAAFWQVLDNNLTGKYGVRPVHTIDEMMLLKQRFTDDIRLYVAKKNGKTIAGTLLYITPHTTHAQYISASPEGKRLRAIDAIYDVILHNGIATTHRHTPRFFDFGKSTEHQGQYLNASLIYQKEGFGARAVCYDTYEWDIE